MNNSYEKLYTPPKEVAHLAEKGLKLREKFGRGGTGVGKNRAEKLKSRVPINSAEVKKIYSYFARHKVDKRAADFGNDEDPSAGYIAWLLWGGEEGKKWIDEIRKELD